MKKRKQNAVFEDIITTISRCFIVLVVIVVICIAFSGIRFVKPGEVAIVLRFGKVVGEESYQVLEELNQARTEFVSNMFADFPYPFITIKTIKRI